MADPRSFITTRPKAEPCPRCARLSLAGHAEGLEYRVDPVPVTLDGELAAVQSGRWTYAVVVDALAYRDATRIGGDAYRTRPPVLAAHRCEHPPEGWCVLAAEIPAVTRLLERARKRTGDDVPAPITETESDALFALSGELGGRVIAHDPHGGTDAPF